MLEVTAPAALDGAQLHDELTAGGLAVEEVWLVGDQLRLDGLAETDRPAVDKVVAAHKPAAPVDHDAEFRKAVEAATTLDALKAALLGTSGPGAEPRRPGA